MIQNYLKTALRSIFRNKLTAFINIAGLALSMTCAVLIYLFITDEISYDQYHKNIDRTYRITRDFRSPDGVPNLHLGHVAPPFGPLLKNDFGAMEVVARSYQFPMVMAVEENGERKKIASEDDVFLVEPELFKIFDIDVMSGNQALALERPYTMMLSESTAKKYFETTDVIGKHLKGGRKRDFEITGVYKDFPPQSHWHPKFLASWISLEDSTLYGRKGLETNWGNNSFSTYVLLDEGADPKKIEARFPDFLNKHYGTYAIANFGAPQDFVASKRTVIYLQKVSDIHLRSHLDSEIENNGNINNVYMMCVIGLFIVLIACFNFINLSTARATKRAKEVGLRKVVGAIKNQLIFQYLSESILVAAFALVLAVAMSLISLDWLNSFTKKFLELNLLTNWPLFAGLVAFAVLVGALAGIYPAFVISSFKPALVLKGQQGSSKGKGGIRKILVIAQFAISVVLIIATAITIRQLNYLNNRELGYNKDQTITLPLYQEAQESYDAFYNELVKSSAIKNVALSSRIPTGRLLDSNGEPRVMKGDSMVNSGVTMKMVSIDEEFFDTYDISMAAGRNLSKAIPTDDSLAFIINETGARLIGWKTNEECIGQDFQYGGVKGKLIGVVKDFHFESLHEEIAPMIFFNQKNYYGELSVKIAGTNMQDGIEHVQKIWKQFLPIRPFDYVYMGDSYRKLYEDEQNQGQLFTIFAGLAIFIACLGLFGLATFSTLQRVKEIGIRKVMGASIPSILALLSKEVVILIIVSNVIAWPFAWYLMGMWLSTFAYHVDTDVVLYILAAVLTVAVALITVSAQTIRAARTNPANTLRYE